MTKKIAAILFAGIFSLISVGLQGQGNSTIHPGTQEFSIVKGEVYNIDRDKPWDFVTFGIAGMEPGLCNVAYVDIIDRKGELISRVENLRLLGTLNTVVWYGINLNSFGIKKDFTLEIHILSTIKVSSGEISTLGNGGTDPVAPIDPEETILIVKYP